VEEDALSFKPPGQRIYSYTRQSPTVIGKGKGVHSLALDPESEDSVVFEAYHVRDRFAICYFRYDKRPCLEQTTWHAPGFKEYHRRMQLFILLYIEGGSYINEEEESWEFVVL
jgi:histone acetyltransferase 1